ncbi:hypothetical protein OHR68_09720 [Spirillospora sp. NBC_00431]
MLSLIFSLTPALVALAGLAVALLARRPLVAMAGGLTLGGVYAGYALAVDFVEFAALFTVMAVAGVALGLAMGWERRTAGGVR